MTSHPARVVRLPTELPAGAPPDALVDVPRDGKTLGEIVMRGNIVMHGYFADADATARAFAGGWFHSGDLAVWHPDGSIAIQDRSKDIIISGGEVRPREPRTLYVVRPSVRLTKPIHPGPCRTRPVWRSNKVRAAARRLHDS